MSSSRRDAAFFKFDGKLDDMNMQFAQRKCQTVLLVLAWGISQAVCAEESPSPLVSISDVDRSIVVEMRYFSDFNFTAVKVPGYEANKCLLVKEAGQSLSEVQQELQKQGMGLKVYDCYRPQSAVDHFMRWTADANEASMKQAFYPNENKDELVKKGYIAERSGHTRGDSIDLTLVRLPVTDQKTLDKDRQQDCTAPYSQRSGDNSVDMGTGYDCFDIRSHTLHPDIQGEAKSNRLLLKQVMERHGFKNYKNEWWHFTYIKPYGEKWFYSFPVR